MGKGAAQGGAGIVRIARRAAARGLRRAAMAVLCVSAAALPFSSLSAWNADRMVQAAAAAGQRSVQAARDLDDLLRWASARDIRTRLRAVNDHFNRAIAFADDIHVWGQEDYWASPIESLSKGTGDCEDYAIAKYFTLAASGVQVRSLRLVYVRAMLPASGGMPARSQAHMVLAYYEEGSEDPMILDNLVGEIRPASGRADLTPVFSFNSEGLWQGAGRQTAGDPLARLSRWRDVVRKARAEGFE
jgi:predicted transglutaminase-like cysteine proteinase